MTMILDSTVRSLRDYLQLNRELRAADEQEPGFNRKHKYLVPERPKACPECLAEESFWVKAYFFRWAMEADLEEVLPVPRYICNCCGLVISVLFAFLVPYRQFTAGPIAGAIQKYLLDRATYREVSGEVASDKDEMQRPNHSQVWRWVDLLAARAVRNLNAALQRACVTAGKESDLAGVHENYCPNAIKAHSLEKVGQLNCGTRLLVLVEVLLSRRTNLVESLQTHFVDFVQPASSILTGRGITLFTPQSSHQVIW